MRINIKPLSVNEAYKGRRFKTDKHKAFQTEFIYKLRPLKFNLKGKLSINLEFGFSSPLSDIDNPLKSTLDCLQKKYGFNDRQVFEMNVKKTKVEIGKEYIDFEIKDLQ